MPDADDGIYRSYLNSTFVLLIPVAMIILFRTQRTYFVCEETVLDFLFYALFTPVCTTMMNRIMFASEQLMAAKSAVSRVEAVIQEKHFRNLLRSRSLQTQESYSRTYHSAILEHQRKPSIM